MMWAIPRSRSPGSWSREGGTGRLICGDRAPCIRDRHGWASLERNFPSAAIWCWLLWRFSRVKARLVPTHPDGCGGLVLLAMPGPLLAFSGQLVNARLIGLERYEHLALDYTTGFDDRWIAHARQDELLGTADIQSLADLGNSYRMVQEMRVVVFGRRDLLTLVFGLLAPICPLVLTVIPLSALLKKVTQAVL